MTSIAALSTFSSQSTTHFDQSSNWLQQQLKLKKADSLNDYFITQESDAKWDKIKGNITVHIKRLIHWLPTGIWIDPSKIGRLINEYRYLHDQGNDTDANIKELCRRVLGDGFYEKSLQEAMEESTVESISNGIRFFGQFIKSPITVGAILPSSPHLAKLIAKDIKITKNADSLGRHILEVGPGTGIFTREIIRNLKPNDRLDLVEYDEKFCNILRSRFGHLPNVRIHHISIINFEPVDCKYDFIISGLPLNAFEFSLVERIYDKFKRVIKDGGKLSYFEYIGLPKIKKIFLPTEQKQDINKILEVKKRFFIENQGTSEKVWLNAPPARVCRCVVSESFS